MRSPHVRNKTGKKPPARKSLKALMHHYNLGNQRHRAMADCIDMKRVCEWETDGGDNRSAMSKTVHH